MPKARLHTKSAGPCAGSKLRIRLLLIRVAFFVSECPCEEVQKTVGLRKGPQVHFFRASMSSFDSCWF